MVNKEMLSDRLGELENILQEVEVTTGDAAAISVDRGGEKSAGLLISARANDRKVITLGNGGSAAIAGHLKNDLVKGLDLQAMNCNEAPLLTAYANDYSYEEAFDRIISKWVEAKDLVIAISSSGASENILSSVETARENGCSVITLSGFSENNPLRGSGDVNFYVPSDSYGFVETAHMALCHFIVDEAVEGSDDETK